MKGLIIKEPHISRIMSRQKTWEIRGCATTTREKIALIRSGSGLIVGTAEIVDCIGPIAPEELAAHYNRHRVSDVSIVSYKKIYAWVIANAQSLMCPVPYKHPQGAIIWVSLGDLAI